MASRDEFAFEMLAELATARWRGREPSAYALAWLADGVLRCGRTGETLDQALGLAGPGVASVRRRLLLIQRDAHLLRAAESVSVDAAADLWEKCARLAPLLKRFEAGKWRLDSVKALQSPPQSWATWEQHALRAFQVGEGVPLTALGLHNRLRNSTPPFSVSDGAPTVLSRFV